MKYAHIDENNNLLGWYTTDIHTNIPTPNIEVTDDVWENAINNDHNKVNNDGTTEYVDPPLPEYTYEELRAAAYPSVPEQLDMQYWDSINGTTVWLDTIAAIKEQYPKPS